MGSNAQEINIVGRKGSVIPPSAIEKLKASVKCDIVVKGEAPEDVYRDAIHRFNEAFIDDASIIVFCRHEDDVAAALQFVQQWDIEVVIACGRHSYYGASSTKGLVIDLCEMKKVSINKEAMTITAGGGCKAIDLETPLQAEGLSVVMGAANDTGIGGITLGGGSGFLTGQHGMVADNLVAAKVVLADGSVLQASEYTNPDLFWCLRGGGSNFGVVTEFTYRVHKQGDVFFGPMVFEPDKTTELLGLSNTLKELVDDNDGKLTIFLAFTRVQGMPRVHPLCLVFYDGPEQKARELLAPLYNLGPIAAMTAVRPYADITKPSPEINGPPTHQRYSTSAIQMFHPLDTDIVKTMIEHLDEFFDKYGDAVRPSKIAIELRSHKKTSSIPQSATAVAARQPAITGLLEAQFDNTVTAELMRQEVKGMMDKCRAELTRKHPEKNIYFNANIATGKEKAEEMFGENLPRLRKLKRKYDPGFVFNKWYPIRPADA